MRDLFLQTTRHQFLYFVDRASSYKLTQWPT